MMRKYSSTVCCATLVAVFAALLSGTRTVRAQETEGNNPEKQMMEKWTAFMTPGVPHEYLKKKAGKWEYKMKIWMAPGAPATESEGTTDSKMIMDGRYLIDHVKGSYDGQPFEGAGVTGYDNLKKKFVGFWIDNFGTGFVTSEGTYDKKTKTITYVMQTPDLMQGKYVKTRSTDRQIDDDTYVTIMYSKAPDGKEFKTMELRYSRVK